MHETPRLQKLVITEPTPATLIAFDNETGVLTMKGHTLPPNSKTFFNPVFEWLESYLKTKPVKTELNISFDFLHTSASKQVFEIIKLLKSSETSGNSITVNWSYESEDEDMHQLGVDFASVLKMKFNYSTFEN